MRQALTFISGAVPASFWWMAAIINPGIYYFAGIATIACIGCAISIAVEE